MKSSDLCTALRERFKQPEWSIFFEVASGTAANAKRHADALAMNMYPSRGLSILGFEIKVTRNDLKRELLNPDKAEEIARFCNEWWLVVPKGLIQEDDNIPIPWGVMECDENGRLRISKRAEPLAAKPVTKEFTAAILRSAGRIDSATIQEIREAAYSEYRKDYDERLNQEIENRTKRFEETKQNIAEFEKATGKTIGQYTDVERLAERIKMAEDIEKLFGRRGTLRQIRNIMVNFLEETAALAEGETEENNDK